MKLGDQLLTSKSERQRMSGTQKRSKSDFIYCRRFTLRPAQNLVKEFREAKIEKRLKKKPRKSLV